MDRQAIQNLDIDNALVNIGATMTKTPIKYKCIMKLSRLQGKIVYIQHVVCLSLARASSKALIWYQYYKNTLVTNTKLTYEMLKNSMPRTFQDWHKIQIRVVRRQ